MVSLGACLCVVNCSSDYNFPVSKGSLSFCRLNSHRAFVAAEHCMVRVEIAQNVLCSLTMTLHFFPLQVMIPDVQKLINQSGQQVWLHLCV